MAGIIADLRVVNGQRGRAAIFKLDDRSGAIEAVVSEELLNANTERLKDDELLILTGKVQPDRFSGGLRLQRAADLDLAEARCRHARFLRVVARTLPPLDAVLAAHPPKQEDTEFGETLTRGVPVRLRIVREQAVGDIDLGERSRFWPSDEARWRNGPRSAARRPSSSTPTTAQAEPGAGQGRGKCAGLHAAPCPRETDPEKRARRQGFTLLTFIPGKD